MADAGKVWGEWSLQGDDEKLKSTGAGCHFLLQGIFLTQGPNLDLLNCRQILHSLSL